MDSAKTSIGKRSSANEGGTRELKNSSDRIENVIEISSEEDGEILDDEHESNNELQGNRCGETSLKEFKKQIEELEEGEISDDEDDLQADRNTPKNALILQSISPDNLTRHSNSPKYELDGKKLNRKFDLMDEDDYGSKFETGRNKLKRKFIPSEDDDNDNSKFEIGRNKLKRKRSDHSEDDVNDRSKFETGRNKLKRKFNCLEGYDHDSKSETDRYKSERKSDSSEEYNDSLNYETDRKKLKWKFNASEEYGASSKYETEGIKLKQKSDCLEEGIVIPKRKSCGTIGEKITVEVNFLKLKFNPKKNVYHYNIQFNPVIPKRLLRYAFLEVAKYFPDKNPAFDGNNNIFSCGKLPMTQLSEDIEIEINGSGKKKTFHAVMKLVSVIEMNRLKKYMKSGSSVKIPQECVQALEIALKSRLSYSNIAVGRSFFNQPTEEPYDLGGGLELWDGFFQTIVLGWKTCFLNIDVVHKGFPRCQNVVDYLKEHCGYKGYGSLDEYGYNNAKRFLKGIKIEYSIINGATKVRVCTVRDLGQSAYRTKFSVDGQNEITVVEYFANEKMYNLKHPELPCIQVGGSCQLPAEFCTIIGKQSLNRRMSEQQIGKMVRYCARPANERRYKIMRHVINNRYYSDPCLNEFGIDISEKLVNVDARILPCPSIRYYNDISVTPTNGSWTSNEYLKKVNLKHWAIINYSRSNAKIGHLIDLMKQCGRKSGITVSQPVTTQREDCINKDSIIRCLKKIKQQYNEIQLILVILSHIKSDLYAKIKVSSEVEVGVLTQCLKPNTLEHINFSTVNNIMKKINTKLNGVNHRTSGLSKLALHESTMMVGADVTHPSPDNSEVPSVAAVTASWDKYAFRYMMEYNVQPPRMEIIQNFENMMINMLKNFESKNSTVPKKIIFYRDGVSDGQFSQVLNTELLAMRRACFRSFGDGYRPAITFVVVQKRHHARFFPLDKKNATHKTMNVPPGTCVDTNITHPTEMDFYLLSHSSIQGTARPTKYHVLYDDNDFSADDLQKLTFDLCHLFSRCDRAVSYPAPTYYAHLAAFRAKNYLEGKRFRKEELSNVSKYSDLINYDIKKNYPMFFV